ncbi:MAG: glutaredoxin domain-containing protein [Clostridium perfringens]|nr:glutaredoxin domain-containing protein [Clostridium perfringens]
MVKVYTTSTCPWCTKAKDYLKSLNIDFEELNVQSDMIARDEMIKKTKQGHVPVLDINGEIIIGFKQDLIDKALNK